MAQTNNSSTPLESITAGNSQQNTLLDECEQHEADSYAYLATLRKDWDQKESILLGYQPEDSFAKYNKSKIVDQSLASMVMERSSRVCAALPVIEAYAEESNSVGMSLLMNIALKHFQAHADEEGSHLLKLRFFDVYSHVYGSMFGLVPWRVNKITGYVGPELLGIPIRDARPQPGRRTIDKMDQFGVRSKVTVSWLKQQADTGAWMNIDKIIEEYKERKDTGASSKATAEQTKSYVERTRFPTQRGDAVFPDIEIFTEYRRDKWITWAPKNVQNKNSRPWILRIVKNPYIDGMLPIVVKHAFPLIDSPIGLGDIERGKTLQFAKNSLINMYMDGVKMALFPPLHINLDNVDPGSIKWGAAEKWFMQHPNADVQVMDTRPTEWINTFQSTYGFLTTEIQNLSGSTTINETPGADPTLGKTPDAIKQYGQNQDARDAWDTFMMEDFTRQVYMRWINLLPAKMSIEQTFSVAGADLQDLQQEFKDEDFYKIFSAGRRGSVTFNKEKLAGDDGKQVTWGFDVAADSMKQNNHVDEYEAATQILSEILENPSILADIRAQGGDINIPELYKRRMIGGGIKDWDKILQMPNPQSQENAQQNQQSQKENIVINYKDAPDDIKRQMEQAAGFKPSQMVTSGTINDQVAKSMDMQPINQQNPSLPVAADGTKDQDIANVMAQVAQMTGAQPQ